MSKQWGHGYHKGVEAAQENNGTLAGLWFHSRVNGKIEWQGRVDRDLKNGSYLVQLLDWIDGDPSVKKIIAATEMAGWDFYATSLDMRYSYIMQTGGTQDDFEWCERIRNQRLKQLA